MPSPGSVFAAARFTVLQFADGVPNDLTCKSMGSSREEDCITNNNLFQFTTKLNDNITYRSACISGVNKQKKSLKFYILG